MFSTFFTHFRYFYDSLISDVRSSTLHPAPIYSLFHDIVGPIPLVYRFITSFGPHPYAVFWLLMSLRLNTAHITLSLAHRPIMACFSWPSPATTSTVSLRRSIHPSLASLLVRSLLAGLLTIPIPTQRRRGTAVLAAAAPSLRSHPSQRSRGAAGTRHVTPRASASPGHVFVPIYSYRLPRFNAGVPMK